jgi:hypothetical protein
MKKNTLNFGFIITHVVGCILLMVGFRQFGFLVKYNITKNMNVYGVQEVVKTTNTPDMMGLFEWLFISSVLALHISLIISILVTLKKKIPLVNLCVVFAFALLALCFQFIRFETILTARSAIFSFFHDDMIAFKYVMPGIAFILLGFIAFFIPEIYKSAKSKSAAASAGTGRTPEPEVRWGL